jgi:hypothetical protein
MAPNDRLRLREAVNVADLKDRDRLVRRIRSIRAGAVLDKGTNAHWNHTHPTELPLSTAFEDAVIAWCDGTGAIPTLPLAGSAA